MNQAPAAGCNIVITGFSGTGKSIVGPRVAALLGWDCFDADAEVARVAGKSIAEIFAQDGEAHFRSLERRALEVAASKSDTVICAGGGAVVDPENRVLMHRAGMVVLLEARDETIVRRLEPGAGDVSTVRPLLAEGDPLQKVRQLKQARLSGYANADWTVHTDELSPDEVALEVVRGWGYWQRARCRSGAARGAAAMVVTASQSYPVYVGWGILEEVGRRMVQAGLSGSAVVVSDDTVWHLYGERMQRFLVQAGFKPCGMTLPPGESSKTLDSVSRIYDFMVDCRVERGDVVVAFGGGVVGDVAGLAAATFLRGLRLVQVPTTLVGMVDSSIGGKVGVDHPRAKNLIGAFHQPALVLSDVQLLTTLPIRELSAGWAEVAKHGFILDREYVDFVDRNAEALMALDRETALEAVSRSAALKARVVSEDERETTGRRTILNYGHTIGHAVEAAGGYSLFLHGEAVAVGMVGAAMLSRRMGMAGPEVVEQHLRLLRKLGLPVSCPQVKRSAVLRAMDLDKKVKCKEIRWVLLEEAGRAVVRNDVPPEYVAEVLPALGMK